VRHVHNIYDLPEIKHDNKVTNLDLCPASHAIIIIMVGSLFPIQYCLLHSNLRQNSFQAGIVII